MTVVTEVQSTELTVVTHVEVEARRLPRWRRFDCRWPLIPALVAEAVELTDSDMDAAMVRLPPLLVSSASRRRR